MMAKTGTTINETPGTPTFDIPINMAQQNSKSHCKTVKSIIRLDFGCQR
jgi:hypothetical protein